jgi:SAM-dependent methyltransferase
MGGEHFMDDAAFVASASADVTRLQESAGLDSSSRLLDWGCGAGRLAVGVKHVLGHVEDYHGVDIQEKLIGWARENLVDEHTRFSLVDVANARYKPDGVPEASIPAEPGSVDVLYAYSVWSHMTPDDVVAYGRIISDLLRPGGRAMLTAFVEDDVESWRVNPRGYGPLEWVGALHCVRFERRYFAALMEESRLRIVGTSQGTETDGQSMFLLEPTT